MQGRRVEALHVETGLVAVAVGYAVAMTQFHDSFFSVIKVMAVFNGLFFAVTAWFTWVMPPPEGPAGKEEPALVAG